MVAGKGSRNGRDTRGAGHGATGPRALAAALAGALQEGDPPAIVAVVGLALMLALPDLPNLGLVIFLGGLAGAIITAFLAGLGD